MGLRDALDAATTIHTVKFAKSAMSQTILSLDVVSTITPHDVLQIYYMVNVVHFHYTAFDQSKVRTSDVTAGSQRDCELNARKQVTQCEAGI